MDQKEIRTKAVLIADLISKNAGAGFATSPEAEAEGKQVIALGLELLVNVFVDLNRLATALESIASSERLSRKS